MFTITITQILKNALIINSKSIISALFLLMFIGYQAIRPNSQTLAFDSFSDLSSKIFFFYFDAFADFQTSKTGDSGPRLGSSSSYS